MLHAVIEHNFMWINIYLLVYLHMGDELYVNHKQFSKLIYYIGVFDMTKKEVLDEVVEILIKKVMENDLPAPKLGQKIKEQIAEGESKDGVYSSTCYREQA